MSKTNDIKKLQADLKANPDLSKRINESVLDMLIAQIKVLGYSISKEDLEDAIKLEGDISSLGAVLFWEHYVIVG